MDPSMMDHGTPRTPTDLPDDSSARAPAAPAAADPRVMCGLMCCFGPAAPVYWLLCRYRARRDRADDPVIENRLYAQ